MAGITMDKMSGKDDAKAKGDPDTSAQSALRPANTPLHEKRESFTFPAGSDKDVKAEKASREPAAPEAPENNPELEAAQKAIDAYGEAAAKAKKRAA